MSELMAQGQGGDFDLVGPMASHRGQEGHVQGGAGNAQGQAEEVW